MSGPVIPPLTVAESDGNPTVRPVRTISLNSADFTLVDQGGGTVRIDVNPGGGTSLTDTFVGFGDSSNLLTGSANFTFVDETGGNGPTVLLTGDKPRFDMQDDTAATDFKTRFEQSGASLFMFGQDSTGTDVEMIRAQPTSIVFNDDGNDLDFRHEASGGGALLWSDAGRVAVGIGVQPSDSTKLQVKSAGNFDPTTSTSSDMNNGVLLDGSGASAGDGNYGGSLVFTGVGSTRRRAAIAAVQTTSDSDEVGIGFFTHDAASPSTNEAVNEHMRLDDNGRLFISDTDIGTTTASGRVHVRTSALASVLQQWETTASPTAADFAVKLEVKADGIPTVNSAGLGAIDFKGKDSGGGDHTYVRMAVVMADKGTTTEDGILKFDITDGGTDFVEHLSMGNGQVVVNEDSRNVDFRVESDGNVDMLKVDAGQDNVGIGTAPDSDVERLHVKGTGTGTLARFESTDLSATTAPIIEFYRNSGSPAVGDFIGELQFNGNDDGGNNTVYAKIRVKIDDETGATEDGDFSIRTVRVGSLRTMMRIKHSEIVFNEDSQDVNFRIESDANANMFKVDAGQGTVGIGSAPISGRAQFQVEEDATFQSFIKNENSTTILNTGLTKNSKIICNPSSDITVTCPPGSEGDRVTIVNVSATNTAQLAFDVSDSSIEAGSGTHPRALSQAETETWLCYKDNNWVLESFV